GPGALSHSLRQIPLVLGIARDIERLAPGALVLNYSNPLTRVCLALTRYTSLRVVGLCHGIAMAYSKVGRVMGWITAEWNSPDERMDDRARMIVGEVVGGRNQYELAVNVVNDGSIQDLRDWAVVEVPAVAGSYGVRGLAMGSLPAGITSLFSEQIAIQDRVVEA